MGQAPRSGGRAPISVRLLGPAIPAMRGRRQVVAVAVGTPEEYPILDRLGDNAVRNILRAMLIVTSLGAAANAATPTSYTLTIYVDEGGVGHVFVELSDGKNDLYAGFYPREAISEEIGRMFALPGWEGGEIRDDRLHSWDVKRSFNITRNGYRRAIQGIEQTRSEGRAWCLTNHCGDFSLAVGKAAGVSLSLPSSEVWKERPAVFGNYLMQHGGVSRDQAVNRCKADVARTVAAGEVSLRECDACSAAEKAENIAHLHQLGDRDIEACSLIGRKGN
jgi:hypothetical protein